MKKSGRVAVTRTTVIVLVSLLLIGLGVGLGSLYTINSLSSSGSNPPPNLPPITSTTSSSGNKSFSASCLPNPVVIGSTTTCTAVLSSYSNSASGTVSWKSTASGTFSTRGECTLNLGACSIGYNVTSAGPETITATFSGNKYNSQSSAVVNLGVSRSSSLTSVACTGVSAIGEKSRCFAEVTGFGIPAGNVTFASTGDGNFSTTDCILKSGSCYVDFIPTSVSTLSQNITATFAGDLDNNASSGSFPLIVGAKTSITTVSCASSSLPIGSNPLACTVAVGGFNPSGNVTLSSTDTSATISPSSCILSSGACQFTYSPSAVGSATISASYSGDANNSASSGTFAISVVQASTTLTVNCSPSSVSIGSSTRCSASVKGAHPTGTISWSTNSQGSFTPTSSSCTLASGSCSITYSPLSLTSPVTITAAYQGDINNGPSSNTFSLMVGLTNSSLQIKCNPNPVTLGSTSSCDATVTGLSPTGSITFTSTDPGASFAPNVCNLSSGPCHVIYQPSQVGPATITGNYTGDFENSPSTFSLAFSVTGAATQTVVSCNPNSLTVGGLTSCTATVSGSNPTGAVTWSNTGTGSGIFSSSSCTLSSGSCSVGFNATGAGRITIIGNYTGDTNNSPSSGKTPLLVAQAASTLAISCTPNPVLSGSATTCTITVTGYNPTGDIIDISSTGVGSFSSTSCTLSSGSCSVTYTATGDTPGSTVVITASYVGDQNNLGSNGSFSVNIE